MKIKKIVSLLTSVAVASLIFSGCGNLTNDADNSEIKLGMISYLNATEENFQGIMKKVEEMTKMKVDAHKPVFFDNANSMQMALESGNIDEISTYKCVATYLAKRNPKIEILENHTLELMDQFCFAFRAEDTELRDATNDVLKNMRTDGTLDRLTREYITNPKDEEPATIGMQHFEGANTIKIGVTGDLPPLDLIRADGTPAGFNTAVLAEIGKRLNKNIELVQIESSARVAALTSKKIDISFWAIIPSSEIIPANIDKPEGIELSLPYFKDKIVHVKLTN